MIEDGTDPLPSSKHGQALFCSLKELRFNRCSTGFFNVLLSSKNPSIFHRAPCPNDTTPFFCETIIDFLYWWAEGKKQLYVHPLGIIDPEVKEVGRFGPGTVVAFRRDVIYVCEGFCPKTKAPAIFGHFPKSKFPDPDHLLYFLCFTDYWSGKLKKPL